MEHRTKLVKHSISCCFIQCIIIVIYFLFACGLAWSVSYEINNNILNDLVPTMNLEEPHQEEGYKQRLIKFFRFLNRLAVTISPYYDKDLHQLAVSNNDSDDESIIIDHNDVSTSCESRCTLISIPKTKEVSSDDLSFRYGKRFLKLGCTNQYGQICIVLNKKMVKYLFKE